jgi:hypothetical protein
VNPAEEWIRARLRGAPPALLETMVAVLPADAALPVPDALAAAALALYARLRGESREEALPLLAADALFTHALEAQAEVDPDGLAALADRMGAAGALGWMMPA